MSAEPSFDTIDDAAVWIAAAVSGGKVSEVKRWVRARAAVVLTRLTAPANAVVTLPHLGLVS